MDNSMAYPMRYPMGLMVPLEILWHVPLCTPWRIPWRGASYGLSHGTNAPMVAPHGIPHGVPHGIPHGVPSIDSAGYPWFCPSDPVAQSTGFKSHCVARRVRHGGSLATFHRFYPIPGDSWGTHGESHNAPWGIPCGASWSICSMKCALCSMKCAPWSTP